MRWLEQWRSERQKKRWERCFQKCQETMRQGRLRAIIVLEVSPEKVRDWDRISDDKCRHYCNMEFPPR